MDIIDLAQQIAEMRGEFKRSCGATQETLERIEGRMAEWPVLCAEHRSACTVDRDAIERGIECRVHALEAAQQPTTVRDVWGWAWRLGAGAAGVAGGALAVRALVMAMHP